MRISIHAPAKGATRPVFLPDNAVFHFNPRSREGSDSDSSIWVTAPYRFQSTLPRRERRHIMPLAASRIGFQSTLPRRERLCILWHFPILYNFNPRSREGSDCLHLRPCLSWIYFNPRSREGSDYICFSGRENNKDFNPRSREGSDLPSPNRDRA